MLESRDEWEKFDQKEVNLSVQVDNYQPKSS